MVKLISGWIREVILNLNVEMISFTLHRFTGLGIVFFLFAHIYSLAHRFVDEKSFNEARQMHSGIRSWAELGC